MQLEQPVEILAFETEITGIVEIIDALGRNVQPIDRDRRLAVLLPVGSAARIRHVEGIHFDQAETSPRDLNLDMAFDTVVDGKLGRTNAVERFQILERHLEESELVALEILRQGKTQHRLWRNA